ncbi:MAG: mevalonate kinase [Candidatus Poseidoniaceae archaeon]
MTFISTSAPGKCILFGEHAVVYGHPAVAVAIDQRISIKIQPSTSGMWLLDGGTLNMSRNPHIKGLIEKLWPVDEGAPPLSIHIDGNIPRASGLGSSAALSVALAGALRLARGRWVKDSESNDQENWAEGYGSSISGTDAYGTDNGLLAYNIEELTLITGKQSVDADESAILAHSVEAAAQNGRASPMDSSTCSHGGIIVISDQIEADLTHLYRRELTMPDGERFWHIHELDLEEISEEIYLVIGSTGVNAPTSKQVAKVARMLEQNPARMEEIETIGKIARRGIDALMAGDYEAVGRTMTENQILLKSIGVSSPELDRLIKAAAPSSLGAKLTGAGGGGCMIALTRNPKATSDAIELAGGRTLISKLGSPGMQIDSKTEITFWTKS